MHLLPPTISQLYINVAGCKCNRTEEKNTFWLCSPWHNHFKLKDRWNWSTPLVNPTWFDPTELPTESQWGSWVDWPMSIYTYPPNATHAHAYARAQTDRRTDRWPGALTSSNGLAILTPERPANTQLSLYLIRLTSALPNPTNTSFASSVILRSVKKAHHSAVCVCACLCLCVCVCVCVCVCCMWHVHSRNVIKRRHQNNGPRLNLRHGG